MNQFPCLIRTSTAGGEVRFALGDPLVEEVGEVATKFKKTWSENYSDASPSGTWCALADAFVLLGAPESSLGMGLSFRQVEVHRG